MKKGLTLIQLATELERQNNAKKDYHASTKALKFEAVDSNKIVLQGVNGGMTLRPIAHQQMANTLAIPKPYYDRLLAEAPDLLAKNVNHWLDKQPATKLVRTIDNEVRAILSDSYRPLDNFQLVEATLPRLIELNAEVMDSQITENRLYLKAVTDRIRGDVKVGDTVQAGIIVSNSEVGQGSLKVEALDFRLVCLNGMIRDQSIRKAHLGRGSRGQDAIEDAREYFRTETCVADDRAFFLKVRDAVGAMFDQVRFDKRVEEYKDAAERKIEADPIKVVEVTAKRFGFTDGEKSSILQHLIRGNDLSAWGLANSITRAAQDVESFDRSVELESLGGTVVQLNNSDWKMLSTVA